jgi:hypothetical protein
MDLTTFDPPTTCKEKIMVLTTPPHVNGRIKALSAVMGAGVVIAMGAITVAYGHDGDTSVAGVNGLPMAKLTLTTAPTELATPFASPTHTATPCPKRATMPC